MGVHIRNFPSCQRTFSVRLVDRGISAKYQELDGDLGYNSHEKEATFQQLVFAPTREISLKDENSSRN